MFVVETLTAEPVYKAFGSSMAAQRWAEHDAYLEHAAQQCQIYRTFRVSIRCRRSQPSSGEKPSAS